MKNFVTSVLLFLFIFSCTKEDNSFVDTTKKAREKAFYQLKRLIETPDRVLKDSLITAGELKDSTDDVHLYRLRTACKILGKENCFNLFQEKNDELALFFTAVANAPEPVIRSEMVTIPRKGFTKSSHFTIDEIQNISRAELLPKVAAKELVPREDLYSMPDEYLRFFLFLEDQIRPQFRDDSYYLLLKMLLLESRPTFKRNSFDVLDITILNDSLYIEESFIGHFSKIMERPQIDVEPELNKEFRRYKQRFYVHQRNYAGRQKELIAPDFYAKKLKKKPVIKKGVFASLAAAGNGPANADYARRHRKDTIKAPPLSRNVAQIYMDTSVQSVDLFAFLEALNREVEVEDVSLTLAQAKSFTEVSFRLLDHKYNSLGNYNYRKIITWPEIVKKPHFTTLRSYDSENKFALLFISPTTAMDIVFAGITEASEERRYSVSFCTDSLREPLNDSLRYRITQKTLLKATEFAAIKPSEHGFPPKLSGGIGFGAGTGTGFGTGTGRTDLGSLMGTSSSIKRRPTVKRRPTGASSAGLTGGRSRANIMRVVRRNMASLKYAYNRRLKTKPGIKGKIVVKWAIDEFGNVLFCKVVSSTMKDPTFEKEVVKKVKAWAFGKINIPGDVTEVSYPFVFSQ